MAQFIQLRAYFVAPELVQARPKGAAQQRSRIPDRQQIVVHDVGALHYLCALSAYGGERGVKIPVDRI